jgi:hypothetical protein
MRATQAFLDPATLTSRIISLYNMAKAILKSKNKYSKFFKIFFLNINVQVRKK